jgi:hypothetical protein
LALIVIPEEIAVYQVLLIRRIGNTGEPGANLDCVLFLAFAPISRLSRSNLE